MEVEEPSETVQMAGSEPSGATPEGTAPEAETAEAEAAGTPDWLQEMTAAQAKESETPDLLAAEEQLAAVEPPLWEQAAEREVPEMEGALPTEQSFVEELPAVEEQTAAGEPPAAEESPAPDWLQAAQPVEGEVQPEGKIPEWLATIGQEEAVETPSPEEETPWTAEEEAISTEPTAAEPLPDWLKGAETVEAAETASSEAEASPGWLKNLGGETEPEAASADIQAPPAPETFRSAWEPEVEMGQTYAEPQAVTGSLSDIQAALNRGDLDTAIDGYCSFIQRGEYLSETIHDLRDALYRYPVDINIWQTLGDAYARNNQLQEALDAYTKAEELLR